MSFYKHHVFFCCNQRPAGERTCCNDKGATALRDYAKRRVKALDMAGPRKIRVNMAGCLDRCERGPVLVVYPDTVWYRYESEQDIDEIIDKHLLGGEPVDRLRLKP